jgi:adenosylhomocysteinase
MTNKYFVKDLKLAPQGFMNLEVAERNMLALTRLRKDLQKNKPFKGLKIGMALHVTKETGVLVRTLIAGGAEVAIASCNPLSTQDDVAAALAKEGVQVYGYKGENTQDYYKFIESVISINPDITIDDGCDLVTEIHTKHPGLIKNIIGGCEETTTGVLRLKAMEKDNALKYPIVAVNDNLTKHLMDNYYGTGQSTLDGIIRSSNILFAGKTVVVAGYGDCGKGISMRSKGMGSNVIVTEVNPFKALQARMDGFRVMPMNDAAKEGDIFITVTGDCDIVTMDHIKLMKSGAILANSGHFDVEIDMKALEKSAKSKRRVRHYLDEYVLKDKSEEKVIYVAGEGRLVNLASAEGHPSEVMSLSFMGQVSACEFLVKNKGKLKPQVYTLPDEYDEKIAISQLEVMNVTIDKLTPKQQKYLASWKEGT